MERPGAPTAAVAVGTDVTLGALDTLLSGPLRLCQAGPRGRQVYLIST